MSNNIYLLDLPSDILINIFKNLNMNDLRNLMISCKTLKNVILNANSIWKSLFQNKLIVHNSADNSQSVTFSQYNQCRISHNWRSGIYRSKVFLHHPVNYMPWLKYYNSEVLLISTGSELRCYSTDRKRIPSTETWWKLKVPTVKRNDVRTNDISRFVVKHNLIVCGNRDGSAAIFKVHDLRQKPKLLYHIKNCHNNGQVEVTGVEVITNNNCATVITISNNSSELLYWNLNLDSDVSMCSNYSLCDKLSSNMGIRCIAVKKTQDKLALGLHKNTEPAVIDYLTGQFILTPSDHINIHNTIRDIQWHDENLITFITHSGSLQTIDIRSGKKEYSAFDPFLSSLYCVKTDGQNAIIVGASEYSRCVLFDIRKSSTHVQMYFTQKLSSPIYSLDFDSTKLIAAADRSVSVLNYNINSGTARVRDYSHAFELVFR